MGRCGSDGTDKIRWLSRHVKLYGCMPIYACVATRLAMRSTHDVWKGQDTKRQCSLSVWSWMKVEGTAGPGSVWLDYVVDYLYL